MGGGEGACPGHTRLPLPQSITAQFMLEISFPCLFELNKVGFVQGVTIEKYLLEIRRPGQTKNLSVHLPKISFVENSDNNFNWLIKGSLGNFEQRVFD